MLGVAFGPGNKFPGYKISGGFDYRGRSKVMAYKVQPGTGNGVTTEFILWTRALIRRLKCRQAWPI